MHEIYRFGPYRLDVEARRLARDETAVPVTLRGFDLLLVLVRNHGKAVPRSRLLEEVWRDVVVEEGNLDTHVSTLRRALGACPGAIETVRGFGYRFAAEVEREPPSAQAAPGAPPPQPAASAAEAVPETVATPTAGESRPLPSPPPGVAAAPPAPARDERSRRASPGRLLAISVGAALAGVVATQLARRALEPAIAPEPAVEGLRSLAVLPFENLSKKPEDAWLASALREVLSSEAARSGTVSALPGETIARLAREIGMPAGATLPAAAVARFRERLGVDLLLAGTYLVVGPARDLRVDLRLYDAASGASRKLWSASGRVDDLLRLVASAGEELRTELGTPAAAGAPEVAAPFPASPEALRLYADGLAELRSFRPSGALDLLRRAVAAAPEFALARGALAAALGQLGHERAARAEAQRALELAGNLPEVDRLELEGQLYALTNQWEQAIEVWRRQRLRDRSSVDVGVALARALTRAVRPREAFELLDALAALPAPKGTDPRIDLARGWAARAAGDFAGMRAAGERTVGKGRALGSELVVAEGLVLVSWADLTLNEWRRGLAPCAEGVRLAEKLDHGFLLGRHQGLCGWNHLNLGELDEAERAFAAALAGARSRGDLDQESDFLYGLGMVAGNRGRAAEQLRLYREQLAVAREAGDFEAEVEALAGVAQAELELTSLDAAEATAREAVALARRGAPRGRLSNAITALGLVRAARGDADGALALLREVIELRRESTPARAGLAWVEVGGIEILAGRHEAAIAAAAEADRLLSPDDASARARSALVRAHAHARLGRAAEARRDYEAVEKVSSGLGVAGGPRAALDLSRAQVLDLLGRRDEAAALWREVAGRREVAELPWVRLETAYRLARQRAEREGSAAARAELERVEAEIRAAKLGALVGEEL